MVGLVLSKVLNVSLPGLGCSTFWAIYDCYFNS